MEPVYSTVVWILRPLLRLAFRWRLSGLENVPRSGPLLVACNHISYLDPLAQGYLLVRRRRRLRYFAKAELWKNAFLRFVLKGCRQIPVERGSGDLGPVEGAKRALAAGDTVILYPEGTITTNADLSPMQGKTGVARIAHETGVAVLPLAVWGTHWVSPKGRERGRRLGRLIAVKAGEPLRFERREVGEDDGDLLRETTARVMGELERLVRELQKDHPDGAAVPPLRDPSKGGA